MSNGHNTPGCSCGCQAAPVPVDQWVKVRMVLVAARDVLESLEPATYDEARVKAEVGADIDRIVSGLVEFAR